MPERLPMSMLPAALHIRRGVTAVVGSGGKTTTLATLATLLEAPGSPDMNGAGVDGTHAATPPRIILTTTTHIRPFPFTPLYTGERVSELAQVLDGHPTVCCGTPAQDGKLAAPKMPFDGLARLADYVLAEADGSRALPIKAHAAHEPVVPTETRSLVIVVGAHGFGSSVESVAHRPEVFCRRSGSCPCDPVTPELVAKVLASELSDGAIPCPREASVSILVTHVADERRLEDARGLHHALGRPVLAVDYPQQALWSIAD